MVLHLLAAIMLLAILGFMGRMDYLEAASQECAASTCSTIPRTTSASPNTAPPQRKGPSQWPARPKQLSRSPKELSLPPDIVARVDLALYSELEGRVPHGAWQKLLTHLLGEWLTRLDDNKGN